MDAAVSAVLVVMLKVHSAVASVDDVLSLRFALALLALAAALTVAPIYLHMCI